MKGILLLLFVFLSPLAVFLTMIVFLPHLNTTIKEELVKTHAYEKVSEQLSTLTADDADSAAINSILQRVLTPEYLQTKAETTIDSSYDWIVGTSSTPPVISFKDIKEDIVRQNPQLLTTIEELSKQVKDAQIAAPADAADMSNPDTQQQDAEMTKSIDQMAALAKSDFTFPLDKQLLGLKSFYTSVHIWQPILIILLLGILFLIGILSHSWKARARWIGVTLLFSAAFGYGFITLTSTITHFVTQLLGKATDTLMTTVSPIVLQVLTNLATAYTQYQTTVCIVSVCLGALCILTSFFLPTSTVPAPLMNLGKQKVKRKRK